MALTAGQLSGEVFIKLVNRPKIFQDAGGVEHRESLHSLAMDPSSGISASTEVISNSDEKSVLREVEQDLGERPECVLSDKIFTHSSNLVEMDKRNIQLHSLVGDAENNPAIRDDLTQPVTQEQWDDLPTNKKGQFTNAAFV